MVVKALHDVCSFSKVRCCLLDIFFLCLKEKVLLICYMLCISFDTAYYDFEVPLPFPLLEESLACSIAFPKLVR
jgi:hypothetical protein